MERFGECLRQETKAFIEVMKGERENPSPPASAMEALRVAVACQVSRKERRPVRGGDRRRALRPPVMERECKAGWKGKSFPAYEHGGDLR
jgi:hypothetical protein